MTRLPSRAALAATARANHRIVAGIVDAGVSSLATFIAGLYATRTLDPDTLGGYALAFSVFVLSGFVPAQLVFAPTEIAAVEYPTREQLPLLRRSLLRGAFVSALSAAVTSLWFVLTPAGIDPAAITALVLTCAAATFVSPIQDHLRRMLHIRGASWRSVVVAITQIVVTIGAVIALPAMGLAPAWVPFGSLVLANVSSLSIGLLLSLGDIVAPAPSRPVAWSRVLRSGRPLLVAGLIPSGATFVVSWLVASIGGPAMLGFVEAARIVSQPVAVLQIGVTAVLGPRATAAAGRLDQARAKEIDRHFLRLIILAGGGWLLLVAAPAPWNPLPTILPTAYAVPGLVAASIVTYTIASISQGRRYELYGAARERVIAQAEAEGNVLRVAIAFGAGFLGAFVAPLGLAALGIVRVLRYDRGLRGHYAPTVDGPGERPDA